MRGFLLDSHVPLAVAEAVRRLSAGCVVEHLATWNGGVLLDADDEQVLSAALTNDLALVTYDVRTIPPILHGWSAADRRLPAVVFVTAGTLPQQDIGGLARRLVQLHQQPEQFGTAFPVLYLQPTRR